MFFLLRQISNWWQMFRTTRLAQFRRRRSFTKVKWEVPPSGADRIVQFPLPLEASSLHRRRPTPCISCPFGATVSRGKWEIDIFPGTRFCRLECLEHACGLVGLAANVVSKEVSAGTERVSVKKIEDMKKYQS